jgi:phospholipid/cholesterol/gamma-HCH transport system substrate-binding protein
MDEDNRREFKQTLAELRVLSHTLAARSAAIDSGLLNAARTLDNTARLSADLPHLVERMQRSADGFDRMTAEMARAGASASTSAEGARNDLRETTAEVLPEMHLLASELREVAGSLRRFSRQLEQNPSVLLYGAPVSKPGPGE